MDRSSVKSRFKMLRDAQKMSQQEIADRYEVGISSWKRFENDSLPRGETLLTIAQSGISIDWLLTGKGSMYIEEEGSNPLLADEDFVCTAILASIDTLDKMPGPVSPAAFHRIFLDQLEAVIVREAEMATEDVMAGKKPKKHNVNLKFIFHEAMGFTERSKNSS